MSFFGDDTRVDESGPLTVYIKHRSALNSWKILTSNDHAHRIWVEYKLLGIGEDERFIAFTFDTDRCRR